METIFPKCKKCGKDCGRRDEPGAWAMFDEEPPYWLCGFCYDKYMLRQKRTENEDEEKLYTSNRLND